MQKYVEKTYYFYFTYSLLKTHHIILSILQYILFKYQFFSSIVSLFSQTTITIHSSFMIEIYKEIIKNNM